MKSSRIVRGLSCLVFLLSCCGAVAQQTCSGYVYDFGTRRSVRDVSVLAPHSSIKTYSNMNGAFSLDINNAFEPFSQNHQSIKFIDNCVQWNIIGEATLLMNNMSGEMVFHKIHVTNGEGHIPVPVRGFYILQVYIGDVNSRLFLYSNGFELVQALKKGSKPGVLWPDSTLILSAEGYYPHVVSLDRFSAHNKPVVGILKMHYDTIHYFNELPRYEAFEMLQGAPPLTNYGEIESVKVLYDFVNDSIYYTNVNLYASHYSFAKRFLKYPHSDEHFLYSQYIPNPQRYLYLITINYHRNIDKFVFQFSSYDVVSCDEIKKTYDKVMKTSFFKDRLVFYANNLKWENCTGIPIITADELYDGQNYQAMNTGKCYGYLKKVDIEELDQQYLGKHDLILLNGIPNDLSVVSGIITTEYQTPLSHINILSHNRKTPNMVLRDGWQNTQMDELLGELVMLDVGSQEYHIQKATLDEANKFWEDLEFHEPVILDKDVETSGLINLEAAGSEWVNVIGGKAANFAELVKLGDVPVPENYFAIPFFYYQQHITDNGIDVFINEMLNDELFMQNSDYRREKLEVLRDMIKDAPLNPELEALASDRINNFDEFPSFKFRSSTNAEDLECFSGAGLYDSYSAKRNNDKKTVEKAIKKVWASLWNFRAFDEREYYNIDHHSAAMGILVHRSFPDEDVNGVVITKNLYNVNHGYTINAQYKEYSIVIPEPGIMHDQLIAYTINFENSHYTFEYLSRSNVPELNGEPVMDEEELAELADYCTRIKKHYYYNLPHAACGYRDFAVDLEFKVDSDVAPRKIYIKQARIYSK